MPRLMDHDAAMKSQPLTWADLIDHTPEAAVAVMEVVLGRRIFARDAQAQLARAKRQTSLGSVSDTVDDFRRCPLSKGIPTTHLHKLIVHGAR